MKWTAILLAFLLWFPPPYARQSTPSHRSSSHSHSRSVHGRTPSRFAFRLGAGPAWAYKAERCGQRCIQTRAPLPVDGRPSGPCPDYVIDHINPLACGGADDPSNLQWQTKAEAKSKDKWERKGCK